MKAREAAALLGVHVSTVRKYYRELGGIKLGRVYCFSADRLFAGVRPAAPEVQIAPAAPASESVGVEAVQVSDPHGLLA